MARRSLKRQQELRPYSKPLDKNGQLRGARKGERRKGVGRPKQGVRASERHEKRLALRASEPAHVILRAHRDIGSLRKRDVFHAIREALITVWKLEDSFHVVQFSVQRTHIHLLVEASDRLALAKGMQTFGISAAKHINALILDQDGKRRRGAVFPDRYYVRILKTPRQVRNCLSYVLNNWRHHGEDKDARSRAWQLDPFSSAVTFEGWKERESRDGERYVQPPDYIAPLVSPPRSWLLSVGWRRYGLISAFEVPGRGDE
ncbi:MAG TPA: transposase [Kofleriaceae bacterium]|nr:transposase [Kofleriaceae bacterium]